MLKIFILIPVPNLLKRKQITVLVREEVIQVPYNHWHSSIIVLRRKYNYSLKVSNWGIEKLSNLNKTTKLLSGEARIWTQSNFKVHDLLSSVFCFISALFNNSRLLSFKKKKKHELYFLPPDLHEEQERGTNLSSVILPLRRKNKSIFP